MMSNTLFQTRPTVRPIRAWSSTTVAQHPAWLSGPTTIAACTCYCGRVAVVAMFVSLSNGFFFLFCLRCKSLGAQPSDPFLNGCLRACKKQATFADSWSRAAVQRTHALQHDETENCVAMNCTKPKLRFGQPPPKPYRLRSPTRCSWHTCV